MRWWAAQGGYQSVQGVVRRNSIHSQVLRFPHENLLLYMDVGSAAVLSFGVHPAFCVLDPKLPHPQSRIVGHIR